jgi:hypothetical protein
MRSPDTPEVHGFRADLGYLVYTGKALEIAAEARRRRLGKMTLRSRRPPADCSRRPIGAARYYRRRAKMIRTMMTMTTTVPIPI